jgi:hypothetical protein
MQTKRSFCTLLCLAATMLMAPTPLPAQLDSIGFPLDVGTRWFYRFESRYNGQYLALHVRVKEIVDTTQDGRRLVRVSRLDGDTTTLRFERWALVGDSLIADTTLLYDPRLVQDTTWTISLGGGVTGTYTLQLRRVTLFGFDRRCQIRKYIQSQVTGAVYWERRTALGIGWYYDYYGGSGLQSDWYSSYSLIGLEKDGVLYGDTVLTSVENGSSSLPPFFALYQNYPNPFNPSTTIEYSIQKSGWVEVAIYDLLGRTITTLVAENQIAGPHRVNWIPTSVSSGVYVYTLRSDAHLSSRKLLYIK